MPSDENTTPKMPAGIDWRAFTPEDSPKTPVDVFADTKYQALVTATIAEGDPAFDFERPVSDFSEGVQRATGAHFRLSSVAEKRPVALVFGSYT